MTTPHFSVLIAQHQRDWQWILDGFKLAEEVGFDTAHVFDHFTPLYGSEDGPCLDGWTLLGGLAAHTSRIKLGILVTGNTYRNPVVLLKQAVTVDHISGGRAIFGLGAGWFEREHDAYGIYFPPLKERVDRFGEALAVVDLLLTEQRSNYDGQFYQLQDAPFNPKPVQAKLPILIGASGPRMLRFVGKYADIWDTFADHTPDSLATYSKLHDDVQRNATEAGRDPRAIRCQVSAGGHNLESVDTFRRHVEALLKVGVTDFSFDLPEREHWDTVRQIAAEVMPEYRRG